MQKNSCRVFQFDALAGPAVRPAAAGRVEKPCCSRSGFFAEGFAASASRPRGRAGPESCSSRLL